MVFLDHELSQWWRQWRKYVAAPYRHGIDTQAWGSGAVRIPDPPVRKGDFPIDIVVVVAFVVFVIILELPQQYIWPDRKGPGHSETVGDEIGRDTVGWDWNWQKTARHHTGAGRRTDTRKITIKSKRAPGTLKKGSLTGPDRGAVEMKATTAAVVSPSAPPLPIPDLSWQSSSIPCAIPPHKRRSVGVNTRENYVEHFTWKGRRKVAGGWGVEFDQRQQRRRQ